MIRQAPINQWINRQRVPGNYQNHSNNSFVSSIHIRTINVIIAIFPNDHTFPIIDRFGNARCRMISQGEVLVVEHYCHYCHCHLWLNHSGFAEESCLFGSCVVCVVDFPTNCSHLRPFPRIMIHITVWWWVKHFIHFAMVHFVHICLFKYCLQLIVIEARWIRINLIISNHFDNFCSTIEQKWSKRVVGVWSLNRFL